MFRSLRFRLPALFLAGIALALLIASAVALRLFQDYARQQSVRELQREAAGLTELFRPQIGTGAKPYGPRALEKATGDRRYLAVARPFEENNVRFGVFAVAKPRAELQAQWVTLLQRLLFGIIGGLLV